MFNGSTVQRYIHVMYAVLAVLICTSNEWANYRSWQFSSHFTAKTMLWWTV